MMMAGNIPIFRSLLFLGLYLPVVKGADGFLRAIHANAIE